MGELLTLEEVGRRLKIKAETVRRFWILPGILPAVKVGRQWRVDADDLPKALEMKALEREAARQVSLQRKKTSDQFSDINSIIAEIGECTRDSEKDQARRDNEGRPSRPPVIPEDEALIC